MNVIDDPSHSNEPERHIRSFVLRAGRMTAGQERAWRELWSCYGLEFDGKPIELSGAFGREAPRMLEIGFGTGDALLNFATSHPQFDCLGIEVHRPGVGHLMLQLQAAAVSNVRLICHDAVEILAQAVPERCLDRVHIFFPDPWHKKRHHKRRLIQSPFIDLIAKTMKPGAILLLSTDWEHYALQMLEVMNARVDFENTATGIPESASGFAARPDHRPLTRFERRGHRLGHQVWDLSFRHKD
jgi:tRNA (guanine-N7-)-methyltransferase